MMPGAETKEWSSILERFQPLLAPSSIAVVGVSQDIWKPGSETVCSLQGFGYPGVIYAVGRSGGEVLGLPVYRSIADLPEAADLALLFGPAPAVPSAVRDCRIRGVKSLIAFGAGFGETGTAAGQRLHAELAAECDGSFRMVGPNCMGVYCPAGGVTQHGGIGYPRSPGEVAFVAQSGVLTHAVISAAPNYGFSLSKVVSYGNAIDVNEADLLEYLGADPDTRIIGMYIEGTHDGAIFSQLLRRIAPKKPVVVWKGGHTPTGARRAASTHTGSLAGSIEVWRAMLNQAGAMPVASLEEMLDLFAALHFFEGHQDTRVGYICSGGGNSVAASDASHMSGLTLPHMSAESQARIASFLLPVGTSASNPVDVFSPFPSSETLRGIMETMAISGEVGAMVVDYIAMSTEVRRLLHFSKQMADDEDPLLPELPVQIRKQHGIPVIVILRDDWDPAGSLGFVAERLRLRRYYQENGVAVYPTAERAFKALGLVARYYQWQQSAGRMVNPSITRTARPDSASTVIARARELRQTNLSEHQTKRVLAAYHIPISKECLVSAPDQLNTTLADLDFPIVLKVDSPDILHKTENGLVRLGLKSPVEVRAAFDETLAGAKQAFPTARINGAIVAEILQPVAELIVGMKSDEQLGPVIMCGLGGIFVEVFRDVALRLAPSTSADAAAMLRETKGYELLRGARGRPKADVGAIEDVLIKLSELVVDLEPDVEEIGINPLMVFKEGGGAVAPDAMLVLKEH